MGNREHDVKVRVQTVHPKAFTRGTSFYELQLKRHRAFNAKGSTSNTFYFEHLSQVIQLASCWRTAVCGRLRKSLRLTQLSSQSRALRNLRHHAHLRLASGGGAELRATLGSDIFEQQYDLASLWSLQLFIDAEPTVRSHDFVFGLPCAEA